MYLPFHVYSEYSFLESGVLISEILKIAKDNNVKNIAITDKNVLIGFPKFNSLAKKYGIKPIFGMDIIVENFLFTLLIKNEEGYKNLCNISSVINAREITIDELKANASGLFIIISTTSPLFENINDEFKNKLASIAKGFEPSSFYIGLECLENSKIPHYELIRNFAYKYSYKIVAHSTIKYIKKEDAIVLDLLKAIKDQTKLDLNYEPKNSLYHLKTDDELIKFYNVNEIDELNTIANSISFEFDKKRGEMLHFPLEDNVTDAPTELIKKVKEGLVKRNINLDEHENYRKRLNYEYKVIKEMGYCDYFLIVQDYVNYAKTHDIPVGPGRGSAAGALISYLLNITDVDPMKYDLLFERFLNPERQTMPDIDIDFSDTKREEVVNYLKEKYGRNKVANIVTVQTIGAKQALRDIGRIYNVSSNDISLLTKLIVDKNNQQATLKEAYEKFPNFKREIDNDSTFKLVYKRALLIEGLGRQRGINAAGIVLNNVPLNSAIPLFNDDIGLITQYEKDYLEDEGFLKMDILGLINLTTIDNCIKLIKKNRNIDVDIKSIDLNDPKIYEPIQKGLTMGLFQLDTSAASSALKQFKPRNFDELAAFISLDRPGPRINLPSYANRLKGLEKVTYLDPSLINALKSTYGIMIYQEQIMIVSQDFAGFSFAEADNLRKACAKKIKNKMEEMKTKFISGALKKGHKIQVINQVYDLISRFAEYGFNKSHAIAYAMITAQMAHLKAYYPLEFYASILDSQNSKNDVKFSKYIGEIKKSGINVHLPDINISEFNFVTKDNTLYMPLTSINGIITRTIAFIIDERNKNGKFKDFLDFVTRMTPPHEEKITDVQISKIIDAGVFDSLYSNRQSLKKSIQSAMNLAHFANNGESLVDDGYKFYYTDASDDLDMRLQLERDAIGVILSDSPLKKYEEKLQNIKISQYYDLKENETANILVLFRNVKKITTKTNKSMCFIEAYDDYDDIDITVFSDSYEKYIDVINKLKKNDVILVNGKLSKNYKTQDLNFILNSIQKVEN